MALVDHLDELRKRLIYIVLIVFVTFFVCYGYGSEIQEFLLKPLRSALSENDKVVFSGLLEKVLAQFQLAFWTSIIASSPLTFFQIWRFIKPGLYDHEVKVVRPLLFLAFLFFAAGVGFGYFIVFPFTFETMLTFGEVQAEAYMNLKDYLVLSTKILIFLGIVFQLPIVLIVIGAMGIVNSKKLISFSRYVIVGFAVLSAMLTPPDPITMLALMLPLIFLYFVGVLLVFLFIDPFQKKREKELETT